MADVELWRQWAGIRRLFTLSTEGLCTRRSNADRQSVDYLAGEEMKRPRGRTLGIAAMAREMGISRQRLWQIMQNEQGLCRLCSLRAVSSGLCEKHFIERRLYHRKRNGYKPKRAGRPGRYPKTFSKAGGR